MAKKVMIDCDVGVDDALALILAFHSTELEVKAVTGVNGNVPLNQVFENIQKVLSLIRPQAKPLIAKGADQTLTGKTIFALALQKDPKGMKKLKEVVIMGGAVRTRGNITPYAEFNIFSDPLAAKTVFESGLLIPLVPLDVTHRVTLSPQWREEKITPLKNSFSKFTIEATGYDTMAEKFQNKQRIYLHDPLAVAVVIDPNLAKKERVAIHVETEEGEHYGQTAEVEQGMKTDVCLGVDAERFLELFVSRLAN